jgi:hypothetical protein
MYIPLHSFRLTQACIPLCVYASVVCLFILPSPYLFYFFIFFFYPFFAPFSQPLLNGSGCRVLFTCWMGRLNG